MQKHGSHGFDRWVLSIDADVLELPPALKRTITSPKPLSFPYLVEALETATALLVLRSRAQDSVLQFGHLRAGLPARERLFPDWDSP
jgi:hypothetical protein